MLGLSCIECTARNGGINFDTWFNLSAMNLAYSAWKTVLRLGSSLVMTDATTVIFEFSVLPMVKESLYDSCSACSLFRSTGSIPQNGSRSWYIRSYSSGNWTL
jgi:hypothetical protein